MNTKPLGKRYIVSISFANYLKQKNGMPKVVMAHQKMYNLNEIGYVSLFSVKKMIFDDKIMLFCKYGMIIDGEFKGIYQMNQIINFFDDWFHDKCYIAEFHIHHLLYNNLNRVGELLNCTPSVPIKVFLHDYYLACENYNLMKNNDFFCRSHYLGDNVCLECKSYKNSVLVEEKLNSFLKKYINRIEFISPSNITKNIFISFHPEYENFVNVVPHQKKVGNYLNNLYPIKNRKVKIGYLGMPVLHKGWNVWTKLVENANHNLYEFYVFNSTHDSYKDMNHVFVSFSKEKMNTMINELRKNDIDIVVLWSIVPETYSYTFFESYASNVFVLTSQLSGNIKDQVVYNKNGIVFENENNLYEFFNNYDRLLYVINKYRQSSDGGPAYLEDNDSLVIKLLSTEQEIIPIKRLEKLNNILLLKLLNFLYILGKI